MPERQKTIKAPKTPEKTFDTVLEKRGRGRPQNIPRSWVIGRADNYRSNLTQVWTELSEPLLKAETKEDVITALKDQGQPYAHNLVPLASEILALIRDRHFPRRPKARIGFLADSLAGMPTIAARTARDICVKERAKGRAKQQAISPHKIIRKEFYIECECGYKGPARDNACRKCGAAIPVSLGALWGNPGSF
jgi:hypothetical protein